MPNMADMAGMMGAMGGMAGMDPSMMVRTLSDVAKSLP